MIRARDIMTKSVVTVLPQTPIREAARLLVEKHFNGLPVVDEQGQLVGIICQNDLVFQQKRLPLPSFFTFLDSLIPLSSEKNIEKEIQKISAYTVDNAMTKDPITVDPHTSLEDIATLMVKNNIHTVPVVDQGQLVGVIGKEDILRTLISEDRAG
jgi:CBS domain-containing protein